MDRHRHLWLRSKAPARDRARAPHDHQGGAGLLRRPRLPPAGRRADLHAQRVRGNEHPVRDGLPRRPRVPDAGPGSSTWRRAAAAFGSAYCFGPTFRAEEEQDAAAPWRSSWMVEPEVAFLDLAGDMQLAEELISFVVGRTLETRRDELKVLERDATALERVNGAPFPRITYGEEAIEILRKNGHPEAKMGDDFGGDEETVISGPVRPSGDRSPVSQGAQGVLLQARRGGRGLTMRHGYPRPRGGTARSSAAASARTISPSFEAALDARAPPAAPGLRVVPRRAPLRDVPARGLRPGHRDARSRGSAASRTCARPSRSRACSTASLRSAQGAAHMKRSGSRA